MPEYSPYTDRAYATSERYVRAWYAARIGKPLELPWTEEQFLTFVRDHLAHPCDAEGEDVAVPAMPPEVDAALVNQGVKLRLGGLSPSTVEQRLHYVFRAHREGGFESPTELGRVRRFYFAARRLSAARQQDSPVRAKGISQPDMAKMLQTCDNSPQGIRDRAMLLFGWVNGGRKRSDIQAASFDHLVSRGHRSFEYRSPAAPGADEAASEHPPLLMSGAAGEAMSAWILLLEERGRDTHTGPIFRSITRSGKIGRGEISDALINEIVKKRADAAGVTGPISSRSLMSGAVTQAQLDSHFPLKR